MLPVLALVGRPNVGKSTLFNRLTASRDAIVDDQPGVTRDRLYGRGQLGGRKFLAVDTGGLEDIRGGDDGVLGRDGGVLGRDGDGFAAGDADTVNPFAALIREQVEVAIDEAQVTLFMVDAADGLVAPDRDIGARLRASGARVLVVVNKSEGVEAELAAAEFQELGLGAPFAISAKRGDGVAEMLAAALARCGMDDGEFAADADAAAADGDGDADADAGRPVIVLAGRPNAGKSTLANRLLRAPRLLVSATPGTTRDSVRVPVEFDGRRCILIDTAGVRKKSRVRAGETVEKFSVIKALQAVEAANVALLVLDATCEIGFQDAAIAGIIRDLGRSLVVVVNKWDRLEARQRRKIESELERKLPFLPDPEILFVSALRGSNLGRIMPAALRAFDGAFADLPTAPVNRALQEAVTRAPPPMHKRRPVRLKFAHQSGKNPPVIVVHGNLAGKLSAGYRRYLARHFARAFRLTGTPVRIIPRNADNPFAPAPAPPRRAKKRSGRGKK
ncbi:MAG: ribosome biogenesis GTPase Der [Gammaproteobacteria bacterium]|nr:ribosome biogenesis GTPase Der [Gammaproteobacteria bacterium]